jgi:GT2 family glycosyltransferase
MEVNTARDENGERDLGRDPSHLFRLSVVVPSHNAERDLPHCVAALEASDLPRETWELVVIDDADGRGPAFSRNRGIDKSRASIVAFVDSDVMVHADALKLILTRFESDDVQAVFGSYDDSPSSPGIVSLYRNLLHAFVHQHAAGDVESFWAGCGAVRKDALVSAGLFDESRFKRPEIEDVELGYRLRDNGFRIVLDPSIQCTHRKRWTLWQMIGSDFSRRGVPWTRLLIDRGEFFNPRGLSLGKAEMIGVVAAPLFVVSLIVALTTWKFIPFTIAAVSLIAFLFSGSRFFNWISRVESQSFLFAAIPLHFVYNLVAFFSLVWGSLTAPFSRTSQAHYKRPR